MGNRMYRLYVVAVAVVVVVVVVAAKTHNISY